MGCSICKDHTSLADRLRLSRQRRYKLDRALLRAKLQKENFENLLVDRYVRDCLPSGTSEISPGSRLSCAEITRSLKKRSMSPGSCHSGSNLENGFEASLLFHFDMLNYRFYWYDTTEKSWKQNSLTKLRFEASSSAFRTNTLSKTEIMKRLHSFSPVAISKRKIHLIGPAHIEYDFQRNVFKSKATITSSTNPVLIYAGDAIYSTSGEKDGKILTKFQRYDLTRNSWTELPEIERPHASGGGLYYADIGENRNTSKRYRILVLGGYCSKDPMIPNPNISIYDPESMSWSYIPVNTLTTTSTVPLFICPKLVQKSNGMICILGSDIISEYYELDLISEQKLIKVGDIQPLEKKNRSPILLTCTINDEDEVEALFTLGFSGAVLLRSDKLLQAWHEDSLPTFD